jgi:Tol biopolymer transport system component/DNA-binding winged helix-turn-helix (wHTH) protein
MPSPARPQEHNSPADGQLIRFDRYQLDIRSGELRKEGRKVRLQAQPFQLLVLLLQNAGRVVTREDVRRELWPGDTFIDFDHGLAAAVNKIRDALCDSADKPRFIETLPRRGYRFIGKLEHDPPVEIRARLEEVPSRETNARESKSETLESAETTAATPTSRTRTWAVGASLVLLGAGIALGFVLLLGQKKSELPPQDWTITQFTSYPGVTTAPAFSPDGSRIAFGWDTKGANNFDLYVKALRGEALLRLTSHPATWLSASWSPDGTQIAFMRIAGSDTGLYVVSALGGAEQKLVATRTPYDLAAPISWSPDGKFIAYSDQIDGADADRMFLYSMDTRESRLFYHDPACRHEAELTFSNDGKQVAWYCVRRLDAIDLIVGDPDGRTRRFVRTMKLVPAGLSWSPDDKKIVMPQVGPDESRLYEVDLNDGDIMLTPAGVSERRGVWATVSAKTSAMAWDAYRYHIDLLRKDLQDPSKPVEPILESSKDENQASYSPDGAHVAFDSNRSGIWSVWLGDADGSNLTQISRDVAGYPRWSPDSRHIAYQQSDGDEWTVYVADINERVGRKLMTSVTSVSAPFWSPDGKWLYFEGYSSFRRKFYRCSLDCNANETLVRDGPKAFNLQATADGSYWYYVRGDEVDRKLFRESFSDGHIGPAEEVAGIPILADEYSFFLGDNGIYFVADDKPKTLSYLDFTTRKTKTLLTTEKNIGSGFWISRDERIALLPQSFDNHQDIMLAEPKR